MSTYLSVIVPAYNEAKSIGRALDAMRAYLDRQPWSSEIIVSADGNDGTRELVAEMAKDDPRLSVIGSADRGGKGKGIRNGIAKAKGQIIGFADADYKTPIEELDKLLPWFEKGYDVVIASRATPDAKVERAQPMYRRIGSKVFGAVVHTLMGLGDVPDTQCGFKFFTRQAARDIFGRQRIDGYMFDIEILRLRRKLGYKLKNVGVRWQDDGDSRYDPIGGTIKNFKELARIRFMQYDLSEASSLAYESPTPVPTAVSRSRESLGSPVTVTVSVPAAMHKSTINSSSMTAQAMK
jgi:dolichyl-phosphate beta-glucosyltransferase